MMSFKPFFFLLLFAFSAALAVAQRRPEISSDSTAERSEVRIGIRYTSDYYFMGRSDAVKAPYLSPAITYYHKSGVFARTSLSYLTAEEEQRIDLYTLSAGYDYTAQRFAFGLSLSEYLFNESSYAVQAEMNTYLHTYVGYDLSAFIAYLDASLGFSDNTDLFLGAEINHPFFLLKNKLKIIPALYAYAGSQQYYSEYYAARSKHAQGGAGSGHGGMGNQPLPEGSVSIREAEKFQLLNYEAELLISYSIHHGRLFAAANWTFPQHPATLLTEQGIYEETLDNGFYWSAGVRYSLFPAKTSNKKNAK